ncbi:MAG TPA: sigma-70 family RNA polymerase sigma factor [Terriglobales bacterium]|nr:sigma-70 family RNA polymerase sigma factor [Terriglobales bacterium]
MESTLEISAIGGAAAEVTPLDFDQVVREHQRRIYRVLLGLVRDPDLANNLTQDCFVRAYQKRDSFRGESSVSTWLISIAINLARDHGRNRRAGFWRRLFSVPAEETEAALETAADLGASAERQLIARQELDRVWEIVDELPERQREVFLLRFAEEMPLEEIARALGRELGTVKAHLFRAVSTVRKRMRYPYGPAASTERG